MKADISGLDKAQREQVEMQWHKQQHKRLELDLRLSNRDDFLKGFVLLPDVWDPFITSSLYHASYLFFNNTLFYDKKALDMGCGSGLMAVVMGRYGAEKVIATDISPYAVKNTLENVKKFDLEDKVEVFHGDLFEKINEKFDCIVFNLPWFPGKASKEDTISGSMLNDGEFIHRFLSEAPDYLSDNGVIVMPYYDLAGPTNDPSVQGPKYGFDVTTRYRIDSGSGIQKGVIRMHELRLT